LKPNPTNSPYQHWLCSTLQASKLSFEVVSNREESKIFNNSPTSSGFTYQRKNISIQRNSSPLAKILYQIAAKDAGEARRDDPQPCSIPTKELPWSTIHA
jgi:hypothetical protein